MTPEINRETTIDEMVTAYPTAAGFLSRKGIRCIICGEPVWGTLADAAREKSIPEGELDAIIRELKEFLVADIR